MPYRPPIFLDWTGMFPLEKCQNADGGWPYHTGGSSWTEPTAYAILALMTRGTVTEPVARGLQWLEAAQHPDGGWSPHPAVRESTWVTAVVALLIPAVLGHSIYERAVNWILARSGDDTGLLIRVRQFLTGNSQNSPGWPWFPGTSAWVTPTALSMLALRKALRHSNSPRIRARLDAGVACLLERVCSDGGWNHGAPQALGYDARSYPETTGVALLALAGRDAPAIPGACNWARQALTNCSTSEGQSWLRLGLLAYGQLPAGSTPTARPPRTIQHAALALLADAACHGLNAFLEG